MAVTFTILTRILDICGPFTGIPWKKNKHFICRPRSVRIGKNWVARPLTVFPNADLYERQKTCIYITSVRYFVRQATLTIKISVTFALWLFSSHIIAMHISSNKMV